jgi:hypothetical protein
MKNLFLPLLFLSSFAFAQIKKNGGKTIETHKDKFGGTYYTYKSNESDTIKIKPKKNYFKPYIDNIKKLKLFDYTLYAWEQGWSERLFSTSKNEVKGLYYFDTETNIFFTMSLDNHNVNYKSLDLLNDNKINTNYIQNNFSHLNLNIELMLKWTYFYIGYGNRNFGRFNSGLIYESPNLNIMYKHHLGGYIYIGSQLFKYKNFNFIMGVKLYNPDANSGLYISKTKSNFEKIDHIDNGLGGYNLNLRMYYKNLLVEINPSIYSSNIKHNQISIGYNLFNFLNFKNKHK